MSNLNNIFQHSHCLRKEQLLGYVNQTLEKEDISIVENHISDCDICSDALDGLFNANLSIVEKDLTQLKDEFDAKLRAYHKDDPKQENDRNNPLVLIVSKKRKLNWIAAASILLIVGLGGYSVFSYIQNQKHEMAMKSDSKSSLQDVAIHENGSDQDREIIKIEVKPEALAPVKNFVNKDKIETKTLVAKLKKAEVAKTAIANKEDKDNSIFPSTSESAQEAVAAPIAAPVTNIDVNINDNTGNYAETEKIAEREKAITAIAPTGKMKKATNVNQNANNQLSYPKQESSNNYSNNNHDAKYIESVNLSKSEQRNEDGNSDLQDGIQFYNNGKYRKSIKALESALANANVTNREDIIYYLGLSYAKQGDTEKANTYFALLRTSNKYKNMAQQEINIINSKKLLQAPAKK
jgi:hypothetical protein